jgi:hypothetical protein
MAKTARMISRETPRMSKALQAHDRLGQLLADVGLRTTSLLEAADGPGDLTDLLGRLGDSGVRRGP